MLSNILIWCISYKKYINTNIGHILKFKKPFPLWSLLLGEMIHRRGGLSSIYPWNAPAVPNLTRSTGWPGALYPFFGIIADRTHITKLPYHYLNITKLQVMPMQKSHKNPCNQPYNVHIHEGLERCMFSIARLLQILALIQDVSCS